MTQTIEQPTSVGHRPDGKWAFDAAVTGCFSDMLSRSIPQYAVMRKACDDIAVRFAQPGTDVVDLGCSRGDAIAGLVDRLGDANRYVGVDVSGPMLDAARERFADQIGRGVVSIENVDLREAFPACRPSVVLSVLTLQFTPIEHRHRIVADIYNALRPGGVLVLVEKILGASGPINDALSRLYWDLKHANGYSRESIDAKRRSLEGVLVPVTATWNEDLLRSAGFDQVDCFWRWMNFAGWVAIKRGA